MNWLIDTNVISETLKPKPSIGVINWIETTPLSELHTSAMNLVEMVYGASKLDDLAKRRKLENWIVSEVRPWFAGRILQVDENVLLRWRTISRERERFRQPSPGVDLLIAATALEHNMGVATRDVAPFVACMLPVLNPFTGERFNGA